MSLSDWTQSDVGSGESVARRSLTASGRVSEGSTLNDLAKNIVLWIVIAVVVATVVSNFSTRAGAEPEIAYSTFLEQVKDGGIAEVVFKGDQLEGRAHQRRAIHRQQPGDGLLGADRRRCKKAGVKFSKAPA